MNKNFLVFAFLFFTFSLQAQDDHGFTFGQVTYRDLNMKVYEKDTAAMAVVLQEFGEAYIESQNDFNLVFMYHARIKILKKSGMSLADIEIPLWKSDEKKEVLRSVKASSFTLEGGSMKQTVFDEKNIFTENRNKHLDVKKFAIPNVREGSVIEFQYVLESPYLVNFRNWEFQSDIPKISSEYWPLIPGNYIYSITVKGFLDLSKNENEVVKDCFTPGGNNADCIRYKLAMKDIPAFVEEDYMTARSNYLCAINFELSEIRYFDGRIDRVTKEWKDAEKELQSHPEFGIQLKRGKDIADEYLDPLLKNVTDPFEKAKKIYTFIQNWYRWNETNGKYSELGIKKAFDKKTGNVGDINLSLVAALRYAGLDVEPVILSTRNNGLPIEVHPVLTDFNYVIAKVNIGGKTFLADATDDFYPFGVLPERCLNGKGRVLGEKESYWIDLKPAERAKKTNLLNLKLGSDGIMRGSLQISFSGYDAIEQRKKLHSFSSQKEYIEDLGSKLSGIEIKEFNIKNADEINALLVHDLQVEIDAFGDMNADNFIFNPFILGRWEKNPFRSSQRFYPVDFATAIESVTILNLEYPDNLEIVNLPENTGLALPNAGGRFLMDVKQSGSRLTLNNYLNIGKTVFSSDEYHYLKELFNRIIQIQNTDLIFKKKT